MRNAECGIEEEGVEARHEGGDAARRTRVHSAFRIPHSAYSRTPASSGASEALAHAQPAGEMNRLRVALAAGMLLATGRAPATAQAGDSVPAERLAPPPRVPPPQFGPFLPSGGFSHLAPPDSGV